MAVDKIFICIEMVQLKLGDILTIIRVILIRKNNSESVNRNAVRKICCQKQMLQQIVRNFWILYRIVAKIVLTLMSIIYIYQISMGQLLCFVYFLGHVARLTLPQTSKNYRLLKACLVCFISNVNSRSRKRRKEAYFELRQQQAHKQT